MTARLEQWTLDVRDVAAMARSWLQPVDEPTPGTRGHPDLVPVDGDAEVEVERLLGLGARPADVGQTGKESWHVLADPEGNPFCLLRRRLDPL